MTNATGKIFNPNLESTDVVKQVIFWGEKVNNWIVDGLNNFIPLNDTQNRLLLYTIYLVMLYVVIRFAERMKPALKFVIIGLILFLIVGFFRF